MTLLITELGKCSENQPSQVPVSWLKHITVYKSHPSQCLSRETEVYFTSICLLSSFLLIDLTWAGKKGINYFFSFKQENMCSQILIHFNSPVSKRVMNFTKPSADDQVQVWFCDGGGVFPYTCNLHSNNPGF